MTPIIPLSNQSFLDTVAFWQGKIAGDYELMEAAYFAIYTEFDKFLNEALLYYALGGTTTDGRTIGRTLAFRDEIHFKNVVGGGNNKFEINVLDRFHNKQVGAKIWVEIFDIYNPFTNAFDADDFKNHSTNMRCLRNYIAHKSPEATQKYIKTNLNSSDFIEPYDYLNQPYSRANTKLCYTVFIQTMQDICELILNPIP